MNKGKVLYSKDAGTAGNEQSLTSILKQPVTAVQRRIILKQRFYPILLSIILMVALFPPSVQAQPLIPIIRVGLLSNQDSVLISADTNFSILDGETGQLVTALVAGEKATITVLGNDITINGKVVKTEKINTLMVQFKGDHYIQVNKKQYRGTIDIHLTRGKTGMTIVNRLPLEQYLYGVIAREMSPTWHLEALKAQSVASRTYALYNLNKHQGDEYDVWATTSNQVYGGRESEVPQVIKAVDDTAGQVIMSQGKVISAYFHSSSGGYTENSENVWGGYEPYLRGNVDYDQNSPQYQWEKQLTVNELTAIMAKAGYKIGTIKVIELAPLTSPPMSIPERGVSGRVKVMQLIGSTGSTQVSGEEIRKVLGLKSALFDVHVMESNLSPLHGQGSIINKPGIHQMSGRPSETILISGFGWGHGLGLSQWGAKAMAEQGPQGDSTYFKEILKHYYQGTTIKKVF